jgi:hypothetical protein
MQTLKLNIDDNFFPHFKAMIECFVHDKKVEIVENSYPQNLVVKSVEEVRQRAREAQKQPSVSQEEYSDMMNKFFSEELKMQR